MTFTSRLRLGQQRQVSAWGLFVPGRPPRRLLPLSIFPEVHFQVLPMTVGSLGPGHCHLGTSGQGTEPGHTGPPVNVWPDEERAASVAALCTRRFSRGRRRPRGPGLRRLFYPPPPWWSAGDFSTCLLEGWVSPAGTPSG